MIKIDDVCSFVAADDVDRQVSGGWGEITLKGHVATTHVGYGLAVHQHASGNGSPVIPAAGSIGIQIFPATHYSRFLFYRILSQSNSIFYIKIEE
jgi:hypothetical protein